MSGDEFYDDEVTSGLRVGERVAHDPLLHNVETCPLCLPGLERLAEAVERIRAHHDRTLGHSPTNRIGYCAEPDAISATYCETGILLARLR